MRAFVPSLCVTLGVLNNRSNINVRCREQDLHGLAPLSLITVGLEGLSMRNRFELVVLHMRVSLPALIIGVE